MTLPAFYARPCKSTGNELAIQVPTNVFNQRKITVGDHMVITASSVPLRRYFPQRLDPAPQSASPVYIAQATPLLLLGPIYRRRFTVGGTENIIYQKRVI
jgi:hypothetical protein